VYSYPYQNHATMEPMNSTARWTPERCEVWTPTQNGESALAATAEASGLPAAKCDVYKQLLGGGFGRRGQTDWIRQTVAIAKEMPSTPIKLVWTREEDMQHGFYHPITQCKLSAGLDAQGQRHGVADADLGPVDRRRPVPGEPAERPRPGDLPRAQPERRRGARSPIPRSTTS
jgi:isoquinoline 1-oxidoreductase beta subunit